MTSFLNVLKNNIKSSYTTRTKEYFQAVIAKWNINGWLNDAETQEALDYLEQYYPTTTEETTTATSEDTTTTN